MDPIIAILLSLLYFGMAAFSTAVYRLIGVGDWMSLLLSSVWFITDPVIGFVILIPMMG